MNQTKQFQLFCINENMFLISQWKYLIIIMSDKVLTHNINLSVVKEMKINNRIKMKYFIDPNVSVGNAKRIEPIDLNVFE